MAFTPQQLLTILDTKEGIFEKKELDPKKNIIPLDSLEHAFGLEQTRIRQFSRKALSEAPKISNGQISKIRDVSFDLNPVPIKGLEDNLTALQQELPTMTHLAVYYGLTLDSQMVLVMQGVQLDGSEEGAKLREKPLLATRSQFTTANPALTMASNKEARQLFKTTFGFIHGKNKFVTGTYIRVGALLEKLADLKQEDGTHLQTTLAFLEPAPDPLTDNQNDLKCFHLVFRGLKADGLTLSGRVYSTYDHEEGYSGPKPSCPPFGETDE